MNKKLSPQEIEAESFRIIDTEAGPHEHLSGEQWQVVRRMIHATADFDIVQTVRFHPQAVAVACGAFKKGAPVYADTAMLAAAVGKGVKDACGTEVFTLVADDEVIRESRATGKPAPRWHCEKPPRALTAAL